MKRSVRRRRVFQASAIAVVTVGIVGGGRLYFNSPTYGLPYYAAFTSSGADRWTALGGTWEVAGGSIRNDSNDRGAKLLTGSPNWKDYVVRGDLQLLGSGSVGVLARVSEAEVGENSHKGYFAGIRTVDNSLVLGAFDFAYHEAANVRLPDPVRPFHWYRIELKVNGCQITASVQSDGHPEIKTAPLNDPDCFRSGSIGLRSNGTGGVWRNVSVTPVNSSAAASGDEPRIVPDTSALQSALLRMKSAPVEPVPTQGVNSLIYLPPFGSPVASVRGSVVLTRPAVYVEESNGGGVEIQCENVCPLKIGDEVEVTGQVGNDKFSPVIRKARVRLLGEPVPVSPLVLTVSQVASGAYDGRLVQVEGFLRNIATGQDGVLTMEFNAGPQSFHALLPAGRSRSHWEHLAPESRLRLRGISVVDARFNKTADPFALLVRSAEDIEVVAGPPWWRPSTLILSGLVGFALIFIFNHLYLLMKHWRFRAIAEEREHLADEIHDTLAQSFAGIRFQLQAIRNSMPPGTEGLERQVDMAMTMARVSHEEARRSIASLRPASLGHVGLLRALRECAERMIKNGKVKVETQGEEHGRDVPLHVKDTLFRIGQEAIANSVRHAVPRTIRITLQQQRATLCLSVEDDGGGFTADGDHAGFGLLGMRRRAESISAALVIRSTPGSGTQVEVKAAVRPYFSIVSGPVSRFLRKETWRN